MEIGCTAHYAVRAADLEMVQSNRKFQEQEWCKSRNERMIINEGIFRDAVPKLFGMTFTIIVIRGYLRWLGI